MTFIHSTAIQTNKQFETQYIKKVQLLLMSDPVERGTAHAMKDKTTSSTMELMHVTEFFIVDVEPTAWQETVKPNLPWAEDHFQERIGGQPLNPSPSEAWWPYARQGNAEHKKDQKFSHTYPERFWPVSAGRFEDTVGFGIRFPYGDLNDVIEVLKKNPRSRQAYLAIWHPEDAYAANVGERVPCSMGYHFIYNPAHHGLDCVYTMRSCDIVRFYRDDLYMAGRLLQHVAREVGETPGELVVHIDNLHCFPGDTAFLRSLNQQHYDVTSSVDRSGYNFGALY